MKLYFINFFLYYALEKIKISTLKEFKTQNLKLFLIIYIYSIFWKTGIFKSIEISILFNPLTPGFTVLNGVYSKLSFKKN